MKSALEEGLRHLPARMGCFPQISGLEVHVNANHAVGSRVESVRVGGAALQPEREYLIVTTEFIHKGGDGYVSLALGRPSPHPLAAKPIDEIIVEYMKAHPVLLPQLEDRIVFLSGGNSSSVARVDNYNSNHNQSHH